MLTNRFKSEKKLISPEPRRSILKTEQSEKGTSRESKTGSNSSQREPEYWKQKSNSPRLKDTSTKSQMKFQQDESHSDIEENKSENDEDDAHLLFSSTINIKDMRTSLKLLNCKTCRSMKNLLVDSNVR